mgnify:CR=1 FL=1
MKKPNVQLVVAVAFIAVIGFGIFSIRLGLQVKPADESYEAPVSEPAKVTEVPTTKGQAGSLSSRQGDGYSAAVTTRIPGAEPQEEEEVWDEAECKAFNATLRAGGVGGDSASAAEMDSWCGLKVVSPAFMKCAIGTTGPEALVKCAAEHVKLEGEDLEEVFDLAKALEAADDSE